MDFDITVHCDADDDDATRRLENIVVDVFFLSSLLRLNQFFVWSMKIRLMQYEAQRILNTKL